MSSDELDEEAIRELEIGICEERNTVTDHIVVDCDGAMAPEGLEREDNICADPRAMCAEGDDIDLPRVNLPEFDDFPLPVAGLYPAAMAGGGADE